MAEEYSWQTPVLDRTGADVAARNEKGCLHAKDLNRMEGNNGYLAALLALPETAANTNWQSGDLVFQRDIARLLAGVAAAHGHTNAVWPSEGWLPPVPGGLAGYNDVNDFELIQLRCRRAQLGNGEDQAHAGEAVLGEGTGVV